MVASMLFGLGTQSANAEIFELFPTGMTSECNEELENVWNNATPGDEIVLNAGIYAQGCRRFVGASGEPGNPIVIRAADGADVLVTRPEATSTQHNNIEIAGSHLVIRGLRFQWGSAGVSFMSGTSNIVFEDNEIFDTYDNALRLNSGSTDSFVIRNNHIHHTGLGGSTGEGMYIGCHTGNCVASNHLIEGNRVHDLRSLSGGGNDGIEIKYKSHSNIIRNNLIYNTTDGQDFPCIFVYGHGVGGPNIVENNFVYNCGEAILVTADVIVRNNVVLSSTVNGIHINRQHPTPGVQNVTVVNNTVYGTHPTCARLNVGAGTNVTVANNAFYCAGSTAVSGNLGGATILNNYVSGSMSSGSVDNLRFFAGGSATNAFANPAADDFHLLATSVLVDAGDGSVPDLPSTDHDGNAREQGAAIDVGAFEFGDTPGNPGVSLTVDQATVDAGDDVTLSWSVNDATSCAASSAPAGVWSGSIAPQAGSQLITDLQADVTFSLSCDNANGNTTRAVSVSVVQPSPDPVPTLRLTLNPATIEAGNTSQLSWGSSDATACEGVAGIAGILDTNGAVNVSPSTTTTYTIRCTGPGGSVTSSATLTVVPDTPDPVPTVVLTVTPTTIVATDSALLNWVSTDATACEGIAGIAGQFGPAGNMVVSPAATTTYTMRCTGPGGAATASATLTVVPGTPDPVPTVILTVTPTAIVATDSALLSWASTNATACEGIAGLAGQFGPAGTMVVTPAATTTYTMRCTGPGGAATATASATLTVIPLPPPNDDTDDDGLPDDWELTHFGGLGQTATGDPDNDGFNNLSEFEADTDPADSAFTPLDTDGDSMPDADEILHFGNLDRDGSGDADGDGITDAAEIANGTDPNFKETPLDDASGGGATGPNMMLWLLLLLWVRTRSGFRAKLPVLRRVRCSPSTDNSSLELAGFGDATGIGNKI